MFLAVEGQSNQPIANHCQNQWNIAQVKSGFGQDRFASRERFGNAAGDTQCPLVVLIVPIGKTDEKTRVCDALHERENPLRLERFLGPRTAPAA